MDAKPCHHPHVQAAADKIFRSAGISHVRIYETESDDYNGMAVGMNVGRSMVILTSATLTLPQRVIEGILAHEAIHIKKRDVLSSQLLRFLFLGAVVGIFLLFEQRYHPSRGPQNCALGFHYGNHYPIPALSILLFTMDGGAC